MTPESQRIAIAEACGWKRAKNASGWSDPRTWTLGGKRFVFFEQLPDYLTDLNAMHEAAKTLNAWQWEMYREHLAEICTPLSQCRDKEQQFKFAMEATAAQRAEAFLRALGKWDDSK